MTAGADGDLALGAGGSEPPVEETAAGRLPGVDGLRGLAALAVVGTHVGFETGSYDAGTVGALLSRLEVSVAVFFVLSGFLLSRPWLTAAARRTPPPRAGAYLWRRALRVLPAYWVAVTLALLLLPENDSAGPSVWVRQLLLVQVYWPEWQAAGLTQMWSLCTEVAFYLVLPVLMGLVLERWRAGRRSLAAVLVLPAGLVALGLVCTGLFAWPDFPLPGSAQVWLLPHAGWFGVGIALAAVSVHIGTGAPAPRVAPLLRAAAQPGACWLAAGALFWLTATPLAGPVTLEQASVPASVTTEVLYGAIAGLLLLPLALGSPTGLVTAVLDSAALRRLGDLSYGIFLFHLVVLEGVRVLLGQAEFSGSFAETFLLTVAGAWVAAAVSRRFLERPAMRLRRLVPGDRPRPAPAGTAP